MATCKQLTAQTPIPDFREVGPGAGYKELYDVSPIDWGLCCGFKGPQTNPSWSPSPSSCLNTQTESSAHSIRGEGELGAWGGGPGHLWHPTYTILWPCILKRENPFKKKGGGGNRGNDKMAIFFQFWSPEKVFGVRDQSIYPFSTICLQPWTHGTEGQAQS